MIEYQLKFKCPNCGRAWIAFDSVNGPAKCRCSTKVTPLEVEEYTLINVRNWQFWDQVEGYGNGQEPSMSNVQGDRPRSSGRSSLEDGGRQNVVL